MQPELQSLVLQIISGLCRDEKTYTVLSETLDLDKLGIKKTRDPNNVFDINSISSSSLAHLQPLSHYEGSTNPIFPVEGAEGSKAYIRKSGPASTDVPRGSVRETGSKVKTPEVRANRQDPLGGRRYTSKERGGALPSNHAVNKTIDTASLQQPPNLKGSNKKPSTRDDSYEVLNKGEGRARSNSRKTASGNFQLPSINYAAGRPLYKPQ